MDRRLPRRKSGRSRRPLLLRSRMVGHRGREEQREERHRRERRGREQGRREPTRTGVER